MMKPIYEFKTIQVELTNACIHSCSNCTRFCGHHKKPFYMEWETFKNAVDSLENWPRLIGIMGGEPTLHPQFERFVNYAYEKHPAQYEIGGGTHPTASLSKYIIDSNAIKTGPLNKFRGLGLWSAVNEKYYKHFELIQDKFVFQCINDHTAVSQHQPWLMTRKEFGIPDNEWEGIRNNCWWHRTLNSPSITPKGAFFCEVAAAMDILFDGPGGWKVEKDWWKRDFNDYHDQLHWCELCCGAFINFDRNANEERDDVSPVMYQKLLDVGSPKAKKEGGVIVHDIGGDGSLKTNPRKNMLLYQSNDELRFTNRNTTLFPKRVHGVVLATSANVNTDKFAAHFDGITVVDTASTKDSLVTLAKTIRDEKDWIALINENATIECDFREKMNSIIFNPGTYHEFLSSEINLFNVTASCLKTKGFSGVINLESIADLKSFWSEDKISYLNDDYNLVEGADLDAWIDKLTHKGIIEFNYLTGHINDMILRRRIEPRIAKIICDDINIEEKIAMLDEIYHESISGPVLANKIKTAIHNLLASELKETTVLNLKESLYKRVNSFCINYALAMLSIGEEKEKVLTDCVINPKNKYNFGLESLKKHYDFFALSANKDMVQTKGMIEEIVDIANKNAELYIAGNRYNGKSISMIISNFGKKAVAFIDDDREGGTFDGLNTISVANFTANSSNAPVLMGHFRDELASYILTKLEIKNFKGNILNLHPLYYSELAMSCDIPALRISNVNLEKIKALKNDNNYIKTCKSILLS